MRISVKRQSAVVTVDSAIVDPLLGNAPKYAQAIIEKVLQKLFLCGQRHTLC
jgi:hypothetical protein